MKLSVVATLYHSSRYLEDFHRRVSGVAKEFAADSYEIVLVNDGSPDDSLDRALDLIATDRHLVLIDLSRNFGHHKAMMTGLASSCGDYVFLIDSDLEEEPEWLPGFVQQLREDKADMVFGVQERRRGDWIERLTGYLFYRVFRLPTGVNQPNNIVTARLMTRRYVDALLRHQERELNIGGLWITTGFRQSFQIVRKWSTSPTTYTLGKKVGHLVNAVTSFSSLPLVLTFYTGLSIFLSAFMYALVLVLRYFFSPTPPDGYTSIVVSIWLFSGLIILFMGVQGVYIAKIFSEVKQRPYTIIRHIYRGSDLAVPCDESDVSAL